MIKKAKKGAVFIISSPNMFAYFLIIAKKYKKLIVIINLSSQHSEKTKNENIRIIKESFSNPIIFEYTYKNCWSSQRVLAIEEGKIYLKNLKQEINFKQYDIFCNPTTSPTSLLIANENSIFWIFHADIDILLNLMLPFQNLVFFRKYKLRIRGIKRVLGFVKINSIFSRILNYQSVWEIYNEMNSKSSNIAILLWPETHIWNVITKEQIDLARIMMKEFDKKIENVESIFVKFHPRQYSLINDKDKKFAIDSISNYKYSFKNINEINNKFSMEALTLEMIYILLNPKNIYSIDMGSTAAYNLSPLTNVSSYTYRLNKNDFHRSMPKMVKFGRFIIKLISINKPTYLKNERIT